MKATFDMKMAAHLPAGQYILRGFIALSLAAIALTLLANMALANPNVVNNGFKPVATVQNKTDYGFRNGSALVAPIPFSNPVIGSGLSIGAGYLFELAPDSDTSFIGLGVMGSDNGSKAYGLASNLAFGNGWSFDLAVAEADVRYDLFFGSLRLPIKQSGELVNGGLDYELTDGVSLGAAVRYINTDIGLSTEGTPIPDDLLPDIGLELASFGLRLSLDERDDSDYPTDGERLNISVNRGYSVSDTSRSYTYATANLDAYRSLSNGSIVAGRLSSCTASSDAPFFDKCSIGFSDGFRGFNPTQFYDLKLVSAQIEYRQRLGNRFGFVVFGGVGWTGPDYDMLSDNGTRVAGGLGLRYRVSQKFPVDFSVDLARNNDDEDFVYIFVGQRF